MTDIEQAQAILARWRENATPGPWQQVKGVDEYLKRGDITDMGEPGSRFVVAEHAGPDATLIVGMCDPALREALDGLLAFAQQDYIGWYGPEPRADDDGEPEPYFPFVEHIAAVIIAIDQRMNA